MISHSEWSTSSNKIITIHYYSIMNSLDPRPPPNYHMYFIWYVLHVLCTLYSIILAATEWLEEEDQRQASV